MVTLANPKVRNIGTVLYDYDSADRFLGNKQERNLAYKTVVHRPDIGHGPLVGGIAIKHYATNIVTYFPDGRVVLSSGGHLTKTTKDRIIKLLPPGFSLYQKKYGWYLVAPDKTEQDFEDGMTIRTQPSQVAITRARDVSRRMTEPEYPGHQPNPRKRVKVPMAHITKAGEKSYKYGDTTYYLEKVPFSGHWLVKAGSTALGGPSPSYGIALANFYAVTGREGQPWVDVWEERDNLQITLYFGEKGDPNSSEEIATWTDDDAREMFTDGFFKSGKNLKASVITYGEDVGLL